MRTRSLAAALVPVLLTPAPALAGPEAVVSEWLVEARSKIPQLDTATLKEWVESDRGFTLLDVRLPKEREAGGSIDPFREVDIPRGYLEFKGPDKLPDTEATIVVYCGSGKRSLLAARTLQRMGYTDVTNYADGLKAWKKAGHSVAP